MKEALISTIEPRETGYRVAQVVLTNETFQPHQYSSQFFAIINFKESLEVPVKRAIVWRKLF